MYVSYVSPYSGFYDSSSHITNWVLWTYVLQGCGRIFWSRLDNGDRLWRCLLGFTVPVVIAFPLNRSEARVLVYVLRLRVPLFFPSSLFGTISASVLSLTLSSMCCASSSSSSSCCDLLTSSSACGDSSCCDSTCSGSSC